MRYPDRIKMYLTKEEAAIINERRHKENRYQAEKRREAAQAARPDCKHEFPNGKHCPMKATPTKDGYCGQHYNMAHRLKQFAPGKRWP